MYNNIQLRIEEKTAIVTIDRESQLNALNQETLQEIKAAFVDLKDNDEVRGVILTGAGSKAFVAGADIKEFMHYTAEEGKILSASGHDVMNYIYHFPKPVIAAINGFALGGGLELALSAHIRIASENAKLGLPEVALGIVPGYGGTQRLAELVGRGKALEMTMSGEMIDAQDALKWGAVNHVVSQEELIAKSLLILEKMYAKSGKAIVAVVHLVNAVYSKDLDGYQEEINTFGSFFGTPDFKEGVDAFLNKRKANF